MATIVRCHRACMHIAQFVNFYNRERIENLKKLSQNTRHVLLMYLQQILVVNKEKRWFLVTHCQTKLSSTVLLLALNYLNLCSSSKVNQTKTSRSCSRLRDLPKEVLEWACLNEIAHERHCGMHVLESCAVLHLRMRILNCDVVRY